MRNKQRGLVFPSSILTPGLGRNRIVCAERPLTSSVKSVDLLIFFITKRIKAESQPSTDVRSTFPLGTQRENQ